MPENQSKILKDPWPIRWLYVFCKPYYADHIAGDLLEIYNNPVNEHSSWKGIRLFFQVMGFFKIRYIKTIDELLKIKGIHMFENYFKISVRNLNRHKLFSLINIAGLAVGLAGSLLITTHLLNEWNYDGHIPDSDQIYYLANGSAKGRFSPAPLTHRMEMDLPEVLTGCRLWNYDHLIATIGDQSYQLDRGLAVDSTFFSLFPNRFIQGSSGTALNQPGSIVLTKTLAQNLFGSNDPIGQRIIIEGEKGTVRAVVEDVPSQTSVPYDFLVNLPYDPFVSNGNWTGNNFFSFVKIHPDTEILELEKKTAEIVKNFAGPELASYGYDVDEYFGKNIRPFRLVSLPSIHLYHPGLSLGEGGSIRQFWILTIIGFLLILIAIINYVNLITAKASLRMKEIGMRKVYGSARNQIIKQFFVESYLITGISFLLAIGLVIIVLPFFSDLVQRNLTIALLFNPETLIGMLCLLLLTGGIAGAYPAVYLSSFTPAYALKGEFKGQRMSLRKSLVIFQFAASIALITITLIVYQQVQLMRQFDAGWDRTTTFSISRMEMVAESYEVIKNELLGLPNVTAVSLTNMIPSQGYIANYNYKTMGEEPRTFSPDNIFSDAGYADLLGLELVAGRFFQESRPADTLTVVINEKFAEELGWENPVGRMLTRGEGYDFKIIGVVRDFYPTSVKRALRPMVIRYADEVYEYLSVSDHLLIKLNHVSSDQVQILAGIYEKYSQGYPFEGVFLDESFQRLYFSEARFGRMFTTFSLLALFIASMGLISLAAFSIERRAKEMAVRKVLGASGPNLILLLIQEYMVLVALAAVLAIPLVYYYSQSWLGDFANRIDLNGWYFAVPVLCVMTFTSVLVFGQSLKVAQNNPINALKQE